MGPVTPRTPRSNRLCDTHDITTDMRVMTANMGSSVLIIIPSKFAKKPNPNEAPNTPSTGKHEAQPIAETMVLTGPKFSIIDVTLMSLF